MLAPITTPPEKKRKKTIRFVRSPVNQAAQHNFVFHKAAPRLIFQTLKKDAAS